MEHNYKSIYKNIEIHQLRKEDIESLRFWRNNPENTRYLKPIPFITEDMQLQWFKRYLEDPDEMNFAIEETETINGLIGSLSLYNFEKKTVEFGKMLIGNPNAHGKCCGVNAIIAVLKLAFNDLNLEKVYLHVYSDNIQAFKVYDKVGFIITETHISNSKKEYVMTIEKHDFERRNLNA